MLISALLYATSFTPWRFRRAGVVSDALGLWARALRCRKQWTLHEARCHNLILDAVSRLAQRRTLIVLGSGLVRDVPIDALISSFERVVLVDVVHLLPVRLRFLFNREVEFVTRDLTGLLGQNLFFDLEKRAQPLSDFQADEQVDFVISANVLSQLALPFERRFPDRLPYSFDDFAAKVIGWHIDDLKGFAAPVCVVSDVVCKDVGFNGEVLSTRDLMHGYVMPPADEIWDWQVAPLGEVGRDYGFSHQVYGYKNFFQAGF